MSGPAGSLVQWFREQDLLRGPFLFVDYWANVFGLRGVTPDDHVRRGFVDLPLFRLGIDRPDLEVPKLRSYLLFFLLGPLLFAFRSFRRLGRYRLRFGSDRGREVLQGLDRFRLTLDPAGHEPDPAGDPDLGPRCDVRIGDTVLARDVLDPYRVAGFSSLFWAANKLPVASLVGLIVVGVMAPLLSAAGVPYLTAAALWAPVGFPILVLILYLAFREWLTALLGALPVLFGAFLFDVVRPSTPYDWSVFFWALAGIFFLYLLADWFFVPRPVPPALLLYTADGPGRPYARDTDAPYWLEGSVYWVWRYLLLSPAELNKFWERDWERVDLWVRADGPDAGQLEWIVTDLHYRELWVPHAKMGDAAFLDRQATKARAAAAGHGAGIWIVEVDADLVFHSPVFRGVSFMVDTGGVPVRGVMHVVRSLWRRIRDTDVEVPAAALDRIRLEQGLDLLGDIPEFISRQARRRMLEEPWTYWRYPLGAARRRDPLLYDPLGPAPPPPAADPSLQVKAPRSP
ncbi:MAG: hypothetical protein KY466_06320 [Gemmatimonadetes bacterium]|nr:hypothetical protein [Gemmatimonadota bacterium]